MYSIERKHVNVCENVFKRENTVSYFCFLKPIFVRDMIEDTS